MMRIISFDVGIKNMAYCLIEITGPSLDIVEKSTRILQWNILNLSENGESIETQKYNCNCVVGISKKTPNGKMCGKKAKYGTPCGIMREDYFCLKHVTNHSRWVLPTKETKLSELKKKKVEELGIQWKKINPQEICSLKKQELAEYLAKYYAEKEFTLLPVSKKRKAGEINLIEIGQNIQLQLDHHLGDLSLDCVVIENQISTIATRMKTIQGMLAQYFIMRKNGRIEGARPPKIEFISSHNKLKGFSLEHTVEIAQEHDKKKYKANKMNGVDVCRRFLDSSINPDLGVWKDEFERNGKKDDLADGFLQGIFYLKREKIISYAENLKINSV